MKVLLVTHDLSYADHIAIARLSSIAKEAGHQTFFCTVTRERFCDIGLLDAVQDIKPDVVGYSVNVVGFKRVVEEHKNALQIHKFRSIMGGPHPTFSPETFESSGMDAYCVGEGDYVFKDFLDGFTGINELRSLIDINKLPLADRDLVLSTSRLGSVPKKTFYATVGCPYSCTYCCNSYYRSLYKGKGSWVRRYSVDRLIDEIERVKKHYRMDFVKFGDDCFAMKADDWLVQFSMRYRSKIGVPFNCYLRIDNISADLIRLLKDAGCHSVHLSIDSLSPMVRETVLGRNFKIDNNCIARNLLRLNDIGIKTFVNFMLAAPLSTLQDDLDTIQFSHDATVTYASYTTTVPMQGTGLHQFCVDEGLINPIYTNDLSGCTERSVLPFPDRDIRYNIYLLGPLLSRYPQLSFLLRLKPNILYKAIQSSYLKHMMEKEIYLV